MGFFNTLTSLLDENSDQSFEKRITGAIDGLEQKLNNGLDKAEDGIKKLDSAGQKIDKTASKINSTINKVDQIANKTKTTE